MNNNVITNNNVAMNNDMTEDSNVIDKLSVEQLLAGLVLILLKLCSVTSAGLMMAATTFPESLNYSIGFLITSGFLFLVVFYLLHLHIKKHGL